MTSNGEVEKPIDIRKIYAIVRKNWMVLSKDPLRLRMLILFPMVMILIFGYTAGKSPTNIPAAIVDYDNTDTSKSVQTRLYATNLFSIKHQFGSQDEGRNAIESGDIKMLFIIPYGFENDIQSGKTAALSLIIDESDPTIAQITRASTKGFVQGLSREITQSRITALSQKAENDRRDISASGGAIAYLSSSENDRHMAGIDSSFREANRISSTADAVFSGTIRTIRSNLGYAYDMNEVLAMEENHTASPGTISTLFALASAKRPGFEQINFYQGLKGANSMLSRDTANIYSDSQAIYSDAVLTKEALRASGDMINSVDARFDEISADAKRASTEAITISEIQPYGSGRKGLDFLIPSILALIVFQGAIMGMGRAIAGERNDGSLTRVFLTPTSNITIIAGTLLFYVIFETVRSSLIVFIAMLLFGVSIKGSIASIIFLIWIYAAGTTGLGMIFSVLSRSQEQYMALSMLISLPSMFLAGVFLPIETMPSVLQGITRILPITYAADALRGVMIKGFALNQVIPDIMFLVGFAVLTITLSVLLFKRELI